MFYNYNTNNLKKIDINNNKPFYNYCLDLCNDVYNDIYYIISDKKYDTQLMIITNYDTIYICFRGSSSFKDWQTNFNLKLETCEKNNKSYMIHAGFKNQYYSVKEKIISNLLYYISNKRYNNIVICGHSLGGALATLCSLDLIDNIIFLNKNIYCVTFGCPRVGDKDFVELYNSYNINSHRIVTSGDPCVKIPFNGDYRHIRYSIYLKNNKTYIKPVQNYSAFKRFYKNMFIIDYTSRAHLIKNYKEQLK